MPRRLWRLAMTEYRRNSRMFEMEVVRTADVVAGEIREIKARTLNTVIEASIEVGRRLCEAKELVPVGNWGSWLRENVDYSERTAQNLMALFEEYGKNGIPKGLERASVTNALALVGLPEDIKGEILDSGAAEDMSTRELKEEIARLRQESENRQVTIEGLIREKNAMSAAQEQMEEDLEDARMQVNTRQGLLDGALRQNEDMERRLKDALEAAKNTPMEPAVVEKVPEEIMQELAELRTRAGQREKSETEILLTQAHSELTERLMRVAELMDQMRREDAGIAVALASRIQGTLESAIKALGKLG